MAYMSINRELVGYHFQTLESYASIKKDEVVLYD